MSGEFQRVAMVSMHTSPTAQPGAGEAGGLNVSMLELARELARRGVEVDLVTRASGAPLSREIADGIVVRELAAGEPGTLLKARGSEVTDEFGEGFATLARSPEGGYDIIHAHYWLSGIAVLPVAIELGLPLVQNFHTLAAMKRASGDRDGDGEPQPVIRLRSETFIANQADALIASSSAEASALIDDVGAPADRTWIVPPGVDLDAFAPRGVDVHDRVRRMLGLESDRPIVVIAGRVQPLKGHELAVRALAELHALRGWAPLLVVAGETAPGHEPFAAYLRSLAGSLGVGSDVRFVGALDRGTLADLLSAAEVTIMPSHSETFGLVAIESAAAGTPVIGFRAGGLSESIEEGVSGILLGTRDARYWGTEIAIMIENDERRSTLELTARAFAERFSWGTAAASLMGVYAGVGRP